MKTVDINTETAVALTRKEKLLRLAELVRSAPDYLRIFHGMERWRPVSLVQSLAGYGPSAFTIAAADPVFKAAGIGGANAADFMKFFEISQDELHEFSCDCGGQILNGDMANRITRLANGPGRTQSSFIANFGAFFRSSGKRFGG